MIRHVGIIERLVVPAIVNEGFGEHRRRDSPGNTKRWVRSFDTDRRREHSKRRILDQMSLSETMPDHLQFPPERNPRPVPDTRRTSGGRMTNWLYLSSMSDWLYLIGSFCFVAGTLLNMVQR